MNTHPTGHPSMDAGTDSRFDATIRARHAVAVARLSPQLRAQLAQRRAAALRGERPGARPQHLRFAVAGFAALCALALGVRLYPQAGPSTPTAPPASVQLASNTGGSLPLDEDPDFYAWLGSADAPRLAME